MVKTVIRYVGVENIAISKLNVTVFKPRAEIYIDEDKCVGCGRCVEVCPEDVYALKKYSEEKDPDKEYKSIAVHPERCILCLSCLEICGKNAIYIYSQQ